MIVWAVKKWNDVSLVCWKHIPAENEYLGDFYSLSPKISWNSVLVAFLAHTFTISDVVVVPREEGLKTSVCRDKNHKIFIVTNFKIFWDQNHFTLKIFVTLVECHFVDLAVQNYFTIILSPHLL